MNMLESILNAALVASPVLVLAALGGLIHHRTGVVNIGLEGQILAGAFIGIITADRLNSVALSFLIAALAGLLIGYLTTVLMTRLDGNEIIVGLGANILLAGVIGFILDDRFASSGTYRPNSIPTVPRPTFGLDNVPIINALVSGNDPLVWALVPICVAVAWLLASTRVGLRVRSIGDDPRTASDLGIRVKVYREGAGAVAGMLAGIGGAHLAVLNSGLFNVGMSAGRGYIALAAVYFGRGRVALTVLPVAVFVLFDATQRRLQTSGIDLPAQLVQTVPYVGVIVALIVPTLRRPRRAQTATATSATSPTTSTTT